MKAVSLVLKYLKKSNNLYNYLWLFGCISLPLSEASRRVVYFVSNEIENFWPYGAYDKGFRFRERK